MRSAEREDPCNEATLRSLLRRQYGLVTLAQAETAGVGRTAVSRRVTSGRWERVLPRVYRDALVPPSPMQDALAAVLWAGDSAVASHVTTGSLMGLDGVGGTRAHLWVPASRAPRSPLVVVHRGEVEAVDRRRIGPVPVTSPARTLIDLASVLDDEDLVAAVEDAIHRGLTTPMSIARRLGALGGTGRAGSTRLRAILDDRGSEAAAASRLEVRIWRTLRAAGLRPVRQHPVRVGDRTYRVDCAFPQWRLAVEGMGDRFHRSPRQRRDDRQRLADLASVWWRVLPVTWQEINDAPDTVVARVVRALTDAA